jgi:hypothetical protein
MRGKVYLNLFGFLTVWHKDLLKLTEKFSQRGETFQPDSSSAFSRTSEI